MEPRVSDLSDDMSFVKIEIDLILNSAVNFVIWHMTAPTRGEEPAKRFKITFKCYRNVWFLNFEGLRFQMVSNLWLLKHVIGKKGSNKVDTVNRLIRF